MDKYYDSDIDIDESSVMPSRTKKNQELYKEVGKWWILLKDQGFSKSDILDFAKRNNIKVVTVADLVKYRIARESIIKMEASANLPTQFGEFIIQGYRNILNNSLFEKLFGS